MHYSTQIAGFTLGSTHVTVRYTVGCAGIGCVRLESLVFPKASCCQ